MKANLEGLDALLAAIDRGIFGSSEVILVHTDTWDKPAPEIGSVLAHEAEHALWPFRLLPR